jgi:putative spermidine/putrescine transport system substrate-binding protein
MRAGGYDIVSAPSEISFGLIESTSVQPINTYLLANYENLFDDLKERSWNKVEENIYGVAQGRGVNLLTYNISKMNNQVINWALTYNPESDFAGKISVHDSPMTIAIAALYLMKANPNLQITDPYSLDQNQFDAVMDLIVSQKSIVGNYWADYLSDFNAIKNNQVDIGLSWQETINAVNTPTNIVNGIKPVEGTTGWVNNWMISKSTKSINCSYKWIDWMISPQTNALTAEWFGEAPANKEACGLTANKNHCAVFNAQDDKFWADIYYWQYPQTKCLDGRTEITCVGYEDWFLTWTNFRNS